MDNIIFDKQLTMGKTDKNIRVIIGDEKVNVYLEGSTIKYELWDSNSTGIVPSMSGERVIEMNEYKYNKVIEDIIGDYLEIKGKQFRNNKINKVALENLEKWNGNISQYRHDKWEIRTDKRTSEEAQNELNKQIIDVLTAIYYSFTDEQKETISKLTVG